jgi:5-oxoprolinase (ATP-hydrolysing) subunit A
MTTGAPRWIPFGDAALLTVRPPETNARALWSRLRRCEGVLDVVVTEDRVCLHFDPQRPPRRIDLTWSELDRDEGAPEARVHTIVARYDGPDLDEVGARTGLSRGEVAELHAAGSYEVRMLGFLPGFAYLGGMDARLTVPRRAEPRPRVARGAIAIAAGYTAVYPFASPGGWNLIGHTVDCELFSPSRGARLALGDRVRFEKAGAP